MSNDLVALDISHYQSDPPWQKLIDNGIVGVILKATEGQTNVDSKFYERYPQAKQAGLGVATYHYLHHGNVAKQIDHYLETVDPAPGERVCIDYEQAGCTLDDLRAAVKALQADPNNLQITIYSGHLVKEHLGSNRDELLATTSLWLAQYSSTPTWPTATWPVWSLWQYTDRAMVAGWGPVDGNRFNGSAENCRKWFGPAGDQPQPQPEPDIAEVQIFTTGRVRLVVNGTVIDAS